MPIDMSAAKAPPRKTGTRKAVAAAAPPDTRTLAERRAQGLMDLASLGQGACFMLGMYADGMNIGRHFPPIASELAKLADRYDSVAKPVDILIEIGPFGALLTAVAPFAMQFAANRGWIQVSHGGAGVIPPSVLEAQAKAELARMQADALRQQQEALNEARKAQADYEKVMAEMTGGTPE